MTTGLGGRRGPMPGARLQAHQSSRHCRSVPSGKPRERDRATRHSAREYVKGLRATHEVLGRPGDVSNASRLAIVMTPPLPGKRRGGRRWRFGPARTERSRDASLSDHGGPVAGSAMVQSRGICPPCGAGLPSTTLPSAPRPRARFSDNDSFRPGWAPTGVRSVHTTAAEITLQ